MGKTDIEKVITMAQDDYEYGNPFEDYKEFSKYCLEDGIEPSEELWQTYQDYYGPREDEEEDEYDD